ncbi:predicted protein [Uncinocarpus reesii 1704]|uniref:C6 finger domain transcription factor nscR n=1 Tax=Uncinocarpus reesii (strain UAMH 1704) TaxID=336963 RepID=C4JFK1_UNCRE|nr:uncharacterized protein UREG_01015 [Uncinocarpus reesii 1704]EEP76166.1 predicted protein [Uncinocarpus reesii 1704]
MDPSSLTNPSVSPPPAARARASSSVVEPLPLFPTVWTPRANPVQAVTPAHVSAENAGISEVARGAALDFQQSLDRNPSTSSPPPASRIRRRNRMITSCLECRRRKLKCDRLHPCSSCFKSKRDCLFLAPATDASSRLKRTEIKEKIGSLERGLELDAAATQCALVKQEEVGDGRSEVEEGGSSYMRGIFDAVATEDSRLPIPKDEEGLEPTPLAVQDAGYEDEADDESFDLGFRLGKMRMTDRIGGFYRPRIADELSAALGMLQVSNTPVAATRTPAIDPRPQKLSVEELHSSFDPSASYVAPRSNLLFGGAERYILADFLPTRVAADRLLQQYWQAVHPVAKIVHRPTFEKQYNDFWSSVSKGMEPTFSLQALVFAALFSAVIPMCREEISRAHSVLVGTAIRLAECMGFHRDPEEYGHGPVESHIRRMIWYQLCFLDIHTSLLQGPRHSIRREDFSTKFPVNMDDSEITTAAPGSIADAPRWTDMTFMRIRFECNELRRLLLVDRIRIEKKQISLTQVLAKIETFRKATWTKYGPLIHVPNPKPIQLAAQHMLSILMCRAYISVLHRYANSVAYHMPDRLNRIVIARGIQMIEDSIALETRPELRLWAWYQRAFNQYHVALLLLMEIWFSPMQQEADRIWRCLEYVFEISLLTSRLTGGTQSQDVFEQRNTNARLILRLLRDRMAAYRQMRRLKIPKSMVYSKGLPPIQEDTGAYTISSASQITMEELVPFFQAPNSDILMSSSAGLSNSTMEGYGQPPTGQTDSGKAMDSQVSFPFPNTCSQDIPAPSQPPNRSVPQVLVSPPVTESGTQPLRASSHESNDSGSSNLWFVSGAGLASAGAAPPIGTSGMGDFAMISPQGDNGKDATAAIDIDWDETVPLFVVNLQSLESSRAFKTYLKQEVLM